MTGPSYAQLTAEAQALVAERDNIESAVKEYESVLETQGVGMDDPLVDREGFPRADIDVYAVRVARNHLIRLRNDYKTITNQIETKLHELHAVAREMPKQATVAAQKVPFAVVNDVSAESPASQAGLVVGDKIVTFGRVDYTNHSDLKALGEVVMRNENQPVRVTVLRASSPDPITLSLTPKKWSGRGLLGCHIVPYKS